MTRRTDGKRGEQLHKHTPLGNTSPQVGRMMTLAQYQKHRSDPANGPVLGPEEAATKFQEVRGAI